MQDCSHYTATTMKTTVGLAFFVLTNAIVAGASSARWKKGELRTTREDCSADYSPYCTCYDFTDGRELSCNINDNEDFIPIRNLLRADPYSDYNTVIFHMRANVQIPQDVLGGKRAEYLDLYYLLRSTPFGEIDADAFTSTANYTKYIFFNRCNLSNFNFSFLSQFTVLEELGIYDASVIKMNGVPFLPQLVKIEIYSTTDFEFWYPASQTPSLKEIRLFYNPDMDDRKMESIFSSMTENYIYQKLVNLRINNNALTRVPSGAFSFPALNSLDLYYNTIDTLTAGSVNTSYSNLVYLNLYGTQLKTVDPGAFVGDFSSTQIDLSRNLMTSFPMMPFRDLLQSMIGHRGFVNIFGSPIVNDCGLAWLLVDNRDLLPYVGGAIANGTLFQDLDPAQYSNCF